MRTESGLVGGVDAGRRQQRAVGKSAHDVSRVIYAEERGDLPFGELGRVEQGQPAERALLGPSSAW